MRFLKACPNSSKQLLHLAPERILGATLKDQLCRFAPVAGLGKFANPLKSRGKKGIIPGIDTLW